MHKRLTQLLNLYRLFGLPGRVALLEKETRELRARLIHQEIEYQSLLNFVQSFEGRHPTISEFKALRSSIGVFPNLIDTFHKWKADNPLSQKEPLVTVIIATYNRSRLLAQRSIPSVLRQTYKNFQLIIIGDGCTDDTVEVVREFNDPRIIFENMSERGSYPTDPHLRWMVAGLSPTNRGLDLALGEYICHLDDDDEFTTDRLKVLVDLAWETKADIIWHPFFWEQQDGRWITTDSLTFENGQVTHASVFYRSWLANIRPSIDAALEGEPADWHRFRRMSYLEPKSVRCPTPLLRHFMEKQQAKP